MIKKYKQQFAIPTHIFKKIVSVKNGRIFNISQPFISEFDLAEVVEFYPNLLSDDDIQYIANLYKLTPNEYVNLMAEIILYFELPQSDKIYKKISKRNIPKLTTTNEHYRYKIILNTGYKQLKNKVSFRNWFILLVCSTIFTDVFRYTNDTFYNILIKAFENVNFIGYCKMYWKEICKEIDGSMNFENILSKTDLDIFKNMNDYDRDVIAKNVILFRTYIEVNKIENFDTESFVRAFKLEVASSI
jgi:hypothetical protein